MRGRSLIRSVGILALTLAAIVTPSFTAARSLSAAIAVIGSEDIQFRAQNEKQAMAFDAALTQALADPAQFGYPWIDAHERSLTIRRETFRTSDSVSVARRAEAASLTIKFQNPRASVAKLTAIAEAVTHLRAKRVPNAELIWKTTPDYRNNRIVITMRRLDDKLLTALAARFGTNDIAVRVEDRGVASSTGRDSDSPPFWGGAKITAPKICTSGFAWNVGGQSAMLMAGHCAPSGGSVSYPNYSNVGTVTAGSGENWSTTFGTRYYTGQTTYRGDVALIKYTSLGSAARIYSGAPGTSTSSVVGEMASRRVQLGDSACVNGVVTGYWCGTVGSGGSNIWYAGDGPDVWARNVAENFALGSTCPTKGDSGAPVYRVKADGEVVALGIHSGSLPSGLTCWEFFTDIRDSDAALPGNLKTL